MRSKKKGFTVLELLIVVVLLFIIVGGVVIYGGIICGVCKGNYWVSNNSALIAIQLDNPEIVRVLKIDRNIFARSEVIAEEENGDRRVFLIDADVFWNAEAEERVE